MIAFCLNAALNCVVGNVLLMAVRVLQNAAFRHGWMWMMHGWILTAWT